jgi:hypothetical protein
MLRATDLPFSSRTVAFRASLYLVPSWKMCPDLDAAADLQPALAVGARVALDHVAQVGAFVLAHVAAPS